MGQGTSTQYTAVQSILNELRSLEAQVTSIHNHQTKEAAYTVAATHSSNQQQKSQIATTFQPDENQLLVFSTLVTFGPAEVLTGPVVGKVTENSARVLLEVNVDCEVQLHVCIIDQSCPDGRLVKSIPAKLPAKRPKVFHISQLSEGQSYRFCFSGLTRHDTINRVGYFKTLRPHQSLRVLALSNDNPVALHPKDENPFKAVADKINNESIDLIVHLGGQVNLTDTLKQCSVMLERYLLQSDQSEESWNRLQNLISDKLRDTYRFTWSLPYTREVLARCANLMIWNHLDVSQHFTFQVDRHGHYLAKTLVMLSQSVYREYQRALWDQELSANATGDYAEVTWEWGADNEGNEEAHFHLLGEVGLFFLDSLGNAVLPDGSIQSDSALLSEAQWALLGQSLYTPGMRRFLLLSTVPIVDYSPSQAEELSQDYSKECIRQHFSYHHHEQSRLLKLLFWWQLQGDVEHCKQNGAQHIDKQVLLVCGHDAWAVDSLIQIRESPSLDSKGSDLMTPPVTDRNIRAVRQLVVGPITNALRPFDCALSGEIVDNNESAADEYGKPLPTVYSYQHVPLSQERCFACVDCVMHGATVVLDSADESVAKRSAILAPCISSSLVATTDRYLYHDEAARRVLPQLLVGPVVGKVTARSAVLLVELDVAAKVSCCLVDTVSKTSYKQTRVLAGRRPGTFRFAQLQPERKYVVSLLGVAPEAGLESHFTTLPSHGGSGLRQAVSLCVVTGHAGTPHDTTRDVLWKDVNELSGPLWGGPSILLHVGGQVFQHDALDRLLLVIHRVAGATSPSDVPLQLLDSALAQMLDVLRDSYRVVWTLPHVRRALATHSNLMVWNDRDVFPGLSRGRGGDGDGVADVTALFEGRCGSFRDLDPGWKPVILQLARQVYREYQRQLWDESACVEANQRRDDLHGASERHFHRLGPVGLLFLDLLGNCVTPDGRVRRGAALLSDEHWQQLEEVLSVQGADDDDEGPLQSVVLVSEFPLVDDSPMDARVKAFHPLRRHLRDRWPYHQSECLKLLHLLFSWKAAQPGRDVVVVCGGVRHGMTSTISDALVEPPPQDEAVAPTFQKNLIAQLAVPPITDAVDAEFPYERRGNVDDVDELGRHRFAYQHSPAAQAGSNLFGLVELLPVETEQQRALMKSSVDSSDPTKEEVESLLPPSLALVQLTATMQHALERTQMAPTRCDSHCALFGAGEHAAAELRRRLLRVPLWLVEVAEAAETMAEVRLERDRLLRLKKSKVAELRQLELELEEEMAAAGKEDGWNTNRAQGLGDDYDELQLDQGRQFIWEEKQEEVATEVHQPSPADGEVLRPAGGDMESSVEDQVQMQSDEEQQHFAVLVGNFVSDGHSSDAARRLALVEMALLDPSFENGVLNAYSWKAIEGSGVPPSDLLDVLSWFFATEASINLQQAFPFPSDATSTDTLLLLLVRHQLDRRERKERLRQGVLEHEWDGSLFNYSITFEELLDIAKAVFSLAGMLKEIVIFNK